MAIVRADNRDELLAKAASVKALMKHYIRMNKRFGGYGRIVHSLKQEVIYWRKRAGI